MFTEYLSVREPCPEPKISFGCTQWRSQPDNLVPLCKFNSLEIDCLTLNEHGNICIAGLIRQAGYATGCTDKQGKP